MALITAPGRRDPTSRIITLTIMMIVVLVAMYKCSVDAQKQHQVTDADNQPMKLSDPDATVTDPFPGIEPSSDLEHNNIIGFVENDDAKEEIARDLTRIRPAFEDAYRWLKGQSHTALAKAAYPRNHWNYFKIMSQPDKWRLKICHVYGSLFQTHELELPDMPKGLGKLFRLSLYDHTEDKYYTVISPMLPEMAHGPTQTGYGTFLASDAMFIKRYAFRTKQGWERTPLFFAKRLYMAKERPTPPNLLDTRNDPNTTYVELKPNRTTRVLDMKFIKSVIIAPPNDGGPDARVPLHSRMSYLESAHDIRNETDAIVRAFAYMYAHTDEELAEMTNEGVTYPSLMKDNAVEEWMRGKIAGFRGHALALKTISFPKDELGLNRYHVLTCSDSRLHGFDNTWTLLVLNIPQGLRDGDEIETEGVFIKRYPYPMGNAKWRWSPMIVCKNIRRIVPEPTPVYHYVLYGVAALIVILALYRSSQHDSASVANMRKRVEERRQAREKKKDEAKEDPTTDKSEESESPG